MKLQIFFLLGCAGAVLQADVVTLKDGSVLKGKIDSISSEAIGLDTAYAGPLRLDREQVVSFSTDEPVYIRLESGVVFSGMVQTDPAGELLIKNPEADIPFGLAVIKESWLTPEQDPARMKDRWNFKVAANVSGKTGNNNEKALGANISAIRKIENTELKIYASLNRKSSDGSTTSDERKAGLRYTSYFGDFWGWYARQELENDAIENIKLRSVTAAGLSYRFYDQEHKKLSANAGLSLRNETYQDGSPANRNVGLDLGLQQFYRFANWVEIHNELTFIPSIQDFSSYLLTQKSYLDFPVAASKVWKVRLGLNNDYNSQPEGDSKALDTTYYSSLIADW